nr:EOG090X03AK [Lepidurus arcticus]
MKLESIIWGICYVLCFLFLLCNIPGGQAKDAQCHIPNIVRGSWFYRENGEYGNTEINADSMSGRGNCLESQNHLHVNFSFLFHEANTNCYHCVQFFVRTVNILDKIESGCKNIRSGKVPNLEDICSGINPDQQLITLFAENFVPVNCRSGLEGVWNFAYQNRFRFTGECNNPDAYIHSCQTAGSQFLITNQKFNITYRKCQGMSETFDGNVEFSCLGDWFVGKNHFFAVANTKESRKDEKFRCFLKNRDDDLYMGGSITPECNTLKSPEESPERYRLKPVKSEIVTPGCNLPSNFSGYWINTANIDADVFINQTHIIETWYPDEGRYRQTVYVCKETRDSRILMTRQNVDGCQKDFVCFDFVPRHHNIIRYRKGIALIKDDFHTVCSWVQFPGKQQWKYDLLLAKEPEPIRCPVAGFFSFQQIGYTPFETRIFGGITDSPRPSVSCHQSISKFSVCDPEQKELTIDTEHCVSVDMYGRPLDIYTKDPVPIRCPVAGKFRFEQQGDIPFETRILGGITESPRPDVYCKENISDFSVCDHEQKEIWIDENYCLSVDYKGRPVDIYSDPDYKLKCVGFWKENLKSYLITYDELDAFSKYRCWVYQRSDLTGILMSQALGPYCTINQDVTSFNYTEGASVSLNMQEYERERDQCPMYFDDGSDPWSTSEAFIKTFSFKSAASSAFASFFVMTATLSAAIWNWKG